MLLAEVKLLISILNNKAMARMIAFSSIEVQGERPRVILGISYPIHLKDHLGDHPSSHQSAPWLAVTSDSQKALERLLPGPKENSMKSFSLIRGGIQ